MYLNVKKQKALDFISGCYIEMHRIFINCSKDQWQSVPSVKKSYSRDVVNIEIDTQENLL